MADEELRAKVTLDATQFSVGVGEIVSKLAALEGAIAGVGSKLDNNLDKSLGQVNQSLQGLSLDSVAGKLAASAEALQGAFNGIVTPASSFEAAVANVNTIAKLSDDQLAALSNQLRTLGTTIGIGIPPTEAAAAMYDVLGAGFTNAADASKVLNASAVASQGGLTTIAQSADLLTSALNAYGLSADNAGRVSSILFTSVDKGKHTFGDLVQGLGQVVPAAAANGVSLEELSSAIAALTANAVRPAQAMTGLNAAIVQLAAPTAEARKAAAGLGIDLDSAAFRSLSLVQKLQALAQAAGKNQSALRSVLGDVNALGVAYTLAGNGAKTYTDALAAATGPGNAAAEAAARNGATLEAAQKKFAAATEALKIALAGGVLPLLTDLTNKGTQVVTFLDSFSTSQKAAAGLALALGTATTTLGAGLLGLAVSARVVAVALGVEVPAAGALAKTALDGVALRATAARTALGGFLTGAIGGPAIVAALGAGLIVLANEFAKVNLEAAKAETALTSLGGGTKKQGGKRPDFSAGGLLAADPKDLKKQGVTDKDVVDQIARLRESKEGLLTEGLGQGVIRNLDDRIAKLETLRQVLARGEKDKPVVPAAKADPVADFLKTRTTPVDAEAEKERKKQRLFDIETAKLSGEERIKQLQALIQKEGLVGDEKRAILTKIANEQQKLDSDAASRQKAALADKKADSVQEIELSKASHAQKIQQLGQLLVRYKEDADFRRRVLQQIAQEEDARDKEREERRKKQADEAKKKQDEANEATQEVRAARGEAIGLRQDAIGGELDKAKTGKKDALVAGLLAERQKLTEESIRLQLAEQLAATQSAEARVQMERNAEERIRQEQQKTRDEFKKYTDDKLADQKRLTDALSPKKASTEFAGQTLTVEELAKQSQARFGSEAVNRDFGERQAATSAARAKALASNLAKLQVSPQTIKNVAGAATASPQLTLAPLRVDINVSYPDGQTQTQRVSIPGVPGPAQGGHGSVSFSPRGRA